MGTDNSRAWGITILRVVVGVVFLMHGGQKLFVFGFHNVGAFMAQRGIPMPMVAGVVVTLVEFFGGLALAFGLVTRIAAALIAFEMLVAVLAVHLRGGFFLPAGYEYPLTLLAANLALMSSGPGAAALDAMIRKGKA